MLKSFKTFEILSFVFSDIYFSTFLQMEEDINDETIITRHDEKEREERKRFKFIYP